MLRSLVGSEMCIRDSINAEYGQPQFVASGSRDKNIFIYNLAQGGQMTMSLDQHENWIRCVAFTASGKHLISCADDGLLLVFDLVAKRMLRKIAVSYTHLTLPTKRIV
eukprot:TRINITY_DN14307_c0_g1_i1.p1 TRINITY_DN14307_c0_g1~~TRINITY_DN14307_c0_g1_i1.p1  ORF type:complete len:108 (-),score=18.99 TRINITY_DN14307_c0_g1_i1:67-390(-)